MSSDVTPLRDAEWTLKCAEIEKQQAKNKVIVAEAEFACADRRYRVALKRVSELKKS